MAYFYNQGIEYSQSSLRSLNISLIELKNFYNEHFKNLNLKCIAQEITQQEFFDEQTNLNNIMNNIKAIEIEISTYNERKGVKRKQLTESERTQIYHYYKTGNYTQAHLSEMYGVSQAAISGVLKNFNT